MYMVIANIFQTGQTYILSKEPLPENLQKIVDEEKKLEEGRAALPFEPGKAKKEEADKPAKAETRPAAKQTKQTKQTKQADKTAKPPAKSTKQATAKDTGSTNKKG